MNGVPESAITLLAEMRDYVAAALNDEREKFKGYEHCSNIEMLETDLARIDKCLATPLIADGDAKDAARYRLLRENNGTHAAPAASVEVYINGESWAPGKLDDQIDSELERIVRAKELVYCLGCGELIPKSDWPDNCETCSSLESATALQQAADGVGESCG